MKADGSIAGKMIKSLFFFVFLAAGCVLMGTMIAGLYRVARPYFWNSAECTVLDSAFSQTPEQTGEPFEVLIEFSCNAGGKSYTSRQSRTFSDAGEAQLLRDSFPAGARVTGYVNPGHAEEAVLVRGSFWSALALLFPLVFIGVGLGGLYYTWLYQPGQAQAMSRKTSAAGGTLAPRLGMTCFFGVFFLAGAAMLYFLVLGQALGILQARSWVETPCVIRSSVVDSSSDGDTFRPLILYEYVVHGREYTSNRYDFSTGYTGGYESKKTVVDQYPAGSYSVCFVNPENAAQAVLNRSWNSGMWYGLFSLPFLGVGLGGLYAIWLYKPRKETYRTRTLASSGRPVVEPDERGPIELKASSTPLGKFIGITFLAMFWNGITGVFVWKVIESWMQGNGEGCLTVFVIPFALIGLLLIYGVFYQFLVLFNPRPVLQLSSGLISPGDSIDIAWRWNGRVSVLSSVKMVLKGTEEATYRRGTTTQTDRSTFLELEIVNTTEAYQMKEGRARIRIPDDTMHSFESSHNKIVWTLHVGGDIKRWPDVNQDFTLRVSPIPLERLGR